MQQIQVLLFGNFWNLGRGGWNIFDLWLVEFVDLGPTDLEGQLNYFPYVLYTTLSNEVGREVI